MTGALPPSPEPGGTDHAQVTGPEVTVRYWAAARSAAGIDSETVTGSTLAEVLDAIHAGHPDRRFRDVIGICSIVVGERPVGARDPGEIRLSAGDTVEFLPPFAGG
jgi:molybdopterin synthase sulfur carrier subunit